MPIHSAEWSPENSRTELYPFSSVYDPASARGGITIPIVTIFVFFSHMGTRGKCGLLCWWPIQAVS